MEFDVLTEQAYFTNPNTNNTAELWLYAWYEIHEKNNSHHIQYPGTTPNTSQDIKKITIIINTLISWKYTSCPSPKIANRSDTEIYPITQIASK